MKESSVRVLDDEDLEFADIMRRLGMQREVATLITYLARAGEATSKEIERATGLRQPEVSEVIRDLRGENMIDVREVKTGGKGRPSLFYTLRIPMHDIIKRLEDDKLKEHAKAMDDIRKLKEQVSSWC
jgi:predicted transcriptional regulator